MQDDTKIREPDALTRPARVLVVEDEPVIALDLTCQVEDAGHVVVGNAVDFASCRRLAEREKPDFALMDMRLRGGDSGEQAATWLYETMNIRCIFVSGNLDEVTREKLSTLDPYDFVGKPFTSAALRAALLKASG